MSLQSWLKNGWLHPHQTSKEEIADLFRIIDRDLKDAAGDISHDWRLGDPRIRSGACAESGVFKGFWTPAFAGVTAI